MWPKAFGVLEYGESEAAKVVRSAEANLPGPGPVCGAARRARFHPVRE